MAIKHHKRPRLIKNFWPQYRARIMMLTVILSVAAVGIAAFSMLLLFTIHPFNFVFWAVCITVFLVVYIATYLTYRISTQPLRDLLAVVVHISGETTDQRLPRPQERRYRNTSFGDALQILYELSSSTSNRNSEVSSTGTTTEHDVNLRSAINAALTSFAVLNHDGTIAFSSRGTPIKTQGDTAVLQLLFPSSDDSLESWLEDNQETAVHAEKVWGRIPDSPADTDNQRLFDVYASYEKGAPNETIITLVDRTAFYQEDEEDLNFIAFAAHELRGPITVIRGYLDVLQDELQGSLADDQKELFHRLTVSANRLSSYISNILNTARYDRRHLNIALTEDTIQNVYSVIQDDMELRATSQNRLLSVNFSNDLPTIAADRASLSEVLGNLIDNAIKYSNEGGAISVTAKQHGDFVDIEVADRGIGMPGNVVSNLFNKFYRSHRSRETVAGSGIGLYISKAISESHGGTISVRSTDGEGSTFTLSIPTYVSVAEKLKLGGNNNEELISHGKGWIKNHSMYRG